VLLGSESADPSWRQGVPFSGTMRLDSNRFWILLAAMHHDTGDLMSTPFRSPDLAGLVARLGAADDDGRPPDRESLWKLALRKPRGPFGVPTDLAVRGAASLEINTYVPG
jgi:hypothetical protein